MVQLPSSVYHRELSGVTPDNVGGIVQNVFIIALLELVSSVVHVIIMWRSCGIRALYQLALVLETQTSSVQSRLILLVIMTLTYCVVHFGVDFTFQIPWVKNHST
ncbi:hypothetical protein PHYBOEH_011744 [Phytophthora boehmeriae]|uniref:Uncharacterized protein n=1 Tax=Phytophthora boehmeriae TaxID=109152 RepID=A0A8T1VG25_9STRA|nr:hypothetical protein PHYBOEH_011744 [Phytophthora boehmeriae]